MGFFNKYTSDYIGIMDASIEAGGGGSYQVWYVDQELTDASVAATSADGSFTNPFNTITAAINARDLVTDASNGIVKVFGRMEYGSGSNNADIPEGVLPVTLDMSYAQDNDEVDVRMYIQGAGRENITIINLGSNYDPDKSDHNFYFEVDGGLCSVIFINCRGYLLNEDFISDQNDIDLTFYNSEINIGIDVGKLYAYNSTINCDDQTEIVAYNSDIFWAGSDSMLNASFYGCTVRIPSGTTKTVTGSFVSRGSLKVLEGTGAIVISGSSDIVNGVGF